MNLPLLYRTLRHLKSSQLIYQLVFRIRAKAGWQRPVAQANFSDVRCLWKKDLSLLLPSGANACEDWEQLTFKFVGLTHSFGSKIDWTETKHGKLWTYNLHYFEFLWGMDVERAKELTLDWIQRHPFSLSAEGWEPYPLSLRIMNWIGYWGTVGRSALSDDSVFSRHFWKSLDLQCDWLTKRLEKHLLGNHYFENGAALWLAGSFCNLKAARKWKTIGQTIVEEQLGEQLLQDGMHFERSPMYHNRVVYLLSWLSQIDPGNFRVYYDRALLAAQQLQHPDGRIALFNDSAFGIYPEVIAEAAIGCFALKAAGYYGMRNTSGDYLICDAGRIGPDYIPGHAHCDIGSFELSLNGNRWITDTGVYHYETSEKRYYSRSTAAHNTFGPQGVEQAEIWSSFRVGNRPDVIVHEWTGGADGGAVLELSHDGFERALKHKADYRRRFEFSALGILRISDRFDSSALLKWEGRLHFAPGVELLEHIGHRVVLQSGKERLQVTLEGVDDVTLKETPYWPEFNTTQSRQALVYSRTAKQGEVRLVLDRTGVTV